MSSIFRFTIAILFLSGISPIFAADDAEFIFNVTVPKNTCNIIIEGTSINKVDFGSVPLKRLASDANNGNIKKPFQVKLSNCQNTSFSGNYLKISGNYVNDGFLDSPEGKDFAIRISDKDGAKASDNVFFANDSKIWTNIAANNMNKTFYTYVMCKKGVADCSTKTENLGQFKSTITITYFAD